MIELPIFVVLMERGGVLSALQNNVLLAAGGLYVTALCRGGDGGETAVAEKCVDRGFVLSLINI